jgi:hypothetical protein
MLSETVKGLASAFESNQKTPEELIYELFKLPNKEVASIGRLLSVSSHHLYVQIKTFLDR